MGAVTGLLGDRVSLGFVEATEDQVCRHLESHMESLPESDEKSRSIVEQMHADEARHGEDAIARGGAEFPEPVKRAMSLVSKLMKLPGAVFGEYVAGHALTRSYGPGRHPWPAHCGTSLCRRRPANILPEGDALRFPGFEMAQARTIS
jgi:hypothetical protein